MGRFPSYPLSRWRNWIRYGNSPHPQRSPIPLLSHTTLPFLSINLSKTPIKLCALITKPFTISASEPLSLPPQHTVILTISSLLPSPVSLAASDSQDNLTPI